MILNILAMGCGMPKIINSNRQNGIFWPSNSKDDD